MNKPQLISFSKVGSIQLGYISVAQNSDLPFEIQRVYWTYYTPDSVMRGYHAHHELQQIIFAVSGSIEFILESVKGEKYTYFLDRPNIGLYIPKLHWRTISFSHNAVLLCLASLEYEESDYIRDYSSFKEINTNTNEI